MVALFAFLHHLAAFSLVAALAVEFVLVKTMQAEPSAGCARRLLATDALFGVSSGVLLAVGLLRVFFFEKGMDYYFHSGPFIAKAALFVAVGLLSIYPTTQFLAWGRALKQGQVPAPSPGKLRTLRAVIHLELIGVVLILICAALMARGIGYFGA